MPIIYKKEINPFNKSLPQSIPEQLAASLGSGIKVPMEQIQNLWQVVDGVDEIKQDIFVTLFTMVGTRPLQRDFGSMLPIRIFEGWNTTLKKQLTLDTATALKTWMSDVITVNSITFDDSQINSQVLTIIINYTINETLVNSNIRISLTSDGTVKIPLSDFTLNGVPLYPK